MRGAAALRAGGDPRGGAPWGSRRGRGRALTRALTTHTRAQMAEALRPGAQPLASGPRGSPEVSQTGTPSSANPNRPASAGRVSFGSMDGVTAQMRLHAAREKHRGEEPDAAHMREVFARAVPAAVAQNTRWDNMATELRRACATMRDGLTHSLRDVEERQRVLEASIPALEAELKEVRNKGAESLEYSEKFFDQVRASHRGLRPPAACLPVARPPPTRTYTYTRTTRTARGRPPAGRRRAEVGRARRSRASQPHRRAAHGTGAGEEGAGGHGPEGASVREGTAVQPPRPVAPRPRSLTKLQR